MQSQVASDSQSDSQEFNFKPHQTLPLYLGARNFTVIA